MLADFVATLTPSPAPVRLTVTATEVQKRGFPVPGKQSPESRQLLDDKGLQDLLTTLHTPATTSPSSHVKAAASNSNGSRTPVQSLIKERFIAIMASAVLATVLILALVAWLSIGHTKAHCSTPECDYYAKYLDDIANASVDPCHDFHAHVCSRWLSRDWRSVKQAVYEGFITQVASHVHKTRTPSRGQSALQKAAQFFQSCVAVVSGQANELDAVKSMLSELGVHWPELTKRPNLLETMFAMTAIINWGSIVQFTMDQPGLLTVRPVAIYAETLRRRRIMLQERAGAGTTYEDYFNRMVSAFGRGKDALSYNSLLELESVVIPRLNHSLVLPIPTTLRDQSMKVVIDASKNAIDHFAWDSALQRHLNTTAEKARVISFENVELFTTFFQLVKDLGEAKMAYYHGWALVQAVSVIGDASLAKLFSIRDEDYKRGSTLYCAQATHRYMGLAFYAGYIRDELTHDMASELSSIVANIQETAKARVAHSEWPDATDVLTRAVSGNSTDATPWISERNDPAELDDAYRLFPDMTVSVTRNFVLATLGRRRTPVDAGMPFLPTSMSARFLYVDHAGRLVLHPLMFELPFFVYGPSFQSVKYGALGGEIADVLSSLVFTRIAELDAEFSSRASKIPCVADKYRPGSGHQIDAVDLQFLRRATSLRFLYEAFKHLDLPETVPLHLKSHAKLTEVQIFFFFWCFIQCGMEYANTMCNEVLGGFDRFAVAYKCDERSAMASSQQCDLFSLSEPALSTKREERNVTGTFSIL